MLIILLIFLSFVVFIEYRNENVVDENFDVFPEKFATQTKLQPTLLDIIQTRLCLYALSTLELVKEK